MNPRAVLAASFVALFSVVLLSGCAEQFIRRESADQMRSGEYEAAVHTLQSGVSRYPESALLRAGLDQAREEAIERLISAASENLANRRLEEAEKILQRAQALDPRNDRTQKLQADLVNERKAAKALTQAEELTAAGNREGALRVVEQGLQLVPRQPGLLAQRKRLQSELGLDAASSARSLSETRPITIDFRSAPLSLVLDAITRNSGVNFILDRDVRQDTRVTIFLKSARVEDAIELVANASQLARRIIDPQTVLLYPNTPEKQREHQEQVIRVFHLSNAEAKSTAAMLRNVLRIKEPFVDERANLVILREPPDIIAIAEKLIALQDVGDPEVMMEVEVLEITSTRLTELGLSFPNSIGFTPLDPTGGLTGLTLNNLRGLNSNRIGVNVGSLLLNLRRETGDVNILANPRIRAKSREKARILIGDKVPVFTTTANGTGFVSESVNYLEVGLKLEIEPVVSPDDEVSLKLALEVSSITDQVRTSNGSVGYQIGTRNAATTLRLRDGETQLLGGLINNEDRASATKVPGLGDLPIAGRLFSSHLDNYARTELVLAITPHIVRSSPTPDIAQSEIWVGTENFTHLRPPPGGALTQASLKSESASTAATGRPAGETAATNVPAPLVSIKSSWEAPATVKPGDSFVATLNIESVNPVHALPLEITFPADKLEVTEVTEGPFVKQDRQDASFNHAVNPGKVIVGLLRNDPGGASGKGGVVSLKFKAKAAGVAEITVSSAKPIGMSGALVMGNLPSARIEIK